MLIFNLFSGNRLMMGGGLEGGMGLCFFSVPTFSFSKIFSWLMAHPRAHMMLGEKKKRESKGNETHRKK